MCLGANSTFLNSDVAANSSFVITHGVAFLDLPFLLEERDDPDEDERLDPPEGERAFFFFLLLDREGERPLSFPLLAGAAGEPC